MSDKLPINRYIGGLDWNILRFEIKPRVVYLF